MAVLGASEVFAVVPPAELRVLATMFEPAAFAEGEVICRAGDPATRMYLIVDGEIEVRLADDSLIDLLRRGAVTGEHGMFGSGERTATLIERGAVRALTLDYQRFQGFLLAFPESSLALLKLTVTRLVNQVNTPREREDFSRILRSIKSHSGQVLGSWN